MSFRAVERTGIASLSGALVLPLESKSQNKKYFIPLIRVKTARAPLKNEIAALSQHEFDPRGCAMPALRHW